jgi:CheY-like chemotaxis protein
MNTTPTSTNYYRCHWCSSINDALTAEWCLCAAAQRTLVCSGCDRCFCTAPERVNRKFWELASAELVARRWQASRQTFQPATVEKPMDVGRPVLLVVDDVKTIHTVVDTILTPFFGTIIHAYSGSEALRIARTVRPDIMLTDALLPGLDGRDVVRFLKNDPSTSSIRTIVMTGLYKGQKYRNEAFRDFMVDGYIEKPVGAAELRQVIRETLEKITPVPALAS